VAEWYDQLVGEEGSEFHRQVIFPGVLRLLALQPNEPILDVACGQGVFCRLLSQHGAKPTGIDASPELIKLARQRSSAPSTQHSTPSTQHSAPSTQHLALPDYLVGDARDLSALAVDHYAAATCILAIQNIDKLPPVFQAISRVLAPQGRLVLVMMHPCFRSPKFTSWGWDEETKTQYRRVDRYLLPRPRVRLSPRLIGIADAALDVSDGLLADLGHLCEASELGAVIEAPRVPLSTAVRAVLATDSGHITTVLTGGDDYEILFTAPPETVNELAELSRAFDVPITAIGRIRSPSIGKQSQITVLDESGEPLIFDRSGWTHF
jgi:ubiquinone/menaquinone biosynthesis C-methylase UbiE